MALILFGAADWRQTDILALRPNSSFRLTILHSREAAMRYSGFLLVVSLQIGNVAILYVQHFLLEMSLCPPCLGS